jgi:hypothetical protein
LPVAGHDGFSVRRAGKVQAEQRRTLRGIDRRAQGGLHWHRRLDAALASRRRLGLELLRHDSGIATLGGCHSLAEQ